MHPLHSKPALVLLLVLFAMPAFAASLADALLAHYRLDTNGCDSLGNCPPFVVTNGDQLRGRAIVPAFFKITTPPFTNGVLYVDGQYEPNGHFVHYLGTAPITNLNYESFTVSLDFYPQPRKRNRSDFYRLEYKLDSWTAGRYSRWLGFNNQVLNADNILTGGYSYRWLGFNHAQNLLTLTLNNQVFVHSFNGAAVKPGRWHNLICSVDLRQRKIFTMFDGQLLETITLPADFNLSVATSAGKDTDREFTFGNYSNGSMFRGYAAHLKLFRRALTEPELANLYQESIGERPTFPGPQFPWLSVILALILAGLLLCLGLWLRVKNQPPRPAVVPA